MILGLLFEELTMPQLKGDHTGAEVLQERRRARDAFG